MRNSRPVRGRIRFRPRRACRSSELRPVGVLAQPPILPDALPIAGHSIGHLVGSQGWARMRRIVIDKLTERTPFGHGDRHRVRARKRLDGARAKSGTWYSWGIVSDGATAGEEGSSLGSAAQPASATKAAIGTRTFRINVLRHQGCTGACASLAENSGVTARSPKPGPSCHSADSQSPAKIDSLTGGCDRSRQKAAKGRPPAADPADNPYGAARPAGFPSGRCARARLFTTSFAAGGWRTRCTPGPRSPPRSALSGFRFGRDDAASFDRRQEGVPILLGLVPHRPWQSRRLPRRSWCRGGHIPTLRQGRRRAHAPAQGFGRRAKHRTAAQPVAAFRHWPTASP